MRNTTMKTVLALLALSLTSASVSGAKPAPAPHRVVFPTGQWPTDVQNVQAAVDLGGTVLLKATNVAGLATAFNFGSPDPAGDITDFAVFLQTNIRMRGEAVGAVRTTILGGYQPITVGVNDHYEYFPNPGHTRIENINFVGATGWAIYVVQAAGVEIVHNRITNVIGAFGIGIPILVNGSGSERRITGKVIIAQNWIEDTSTNENERSESIIIGDVAADMDIVGNWVQGSQNFAGIEVVRHVEGTVRIADNFVSPSPESSVHAKGIYIFENNTWDDIRASSPVYQVVGNRVLNKNADAGISFVRPQGPPIYAPIIERNHVTLHGSLAGIDLGGNVSNARVSNNRIDGDGEVGLEIFTYEPGQLAESNRFQGNNLTHFTANTADLFLDTHTRNTVAKGHFSSVIDLGIGNRITGVRR